MLSGIDFRRKLGKSIAIYPFNENNIQSANICITASEFAWSIGERKDLFTSVNGKDQISIPAKQSALIFAKEAIYLGDKLAGVCLPRLDLSLDGLVCNGGPMKPEKAELIKIAMHNQTEETVYIDVGQRIAVLMFHELASKDPTTEEQEKDHNKKIEVFLSKCDNQEKVKRLDDKKKLNSKETITAIMTNDSGYKEFQRSKNTLPDKIARNKVLNISGLILVVLLALLGIMGYKQSSVVPLLTVLTTIDAPVFIGLLLKKIKVE